MEFYVSWYPGDPQYPLYDSNCAMLISISSVPKTWTLDRLDILPQRLIIDSGGFRYATVPKEALSPRQVFKRQLTILGDATLDTIICPRDYPLISPNLTPNQKDFCITQTIAYAYEFQALQQQIKTPSHWQTMAVIQGYDEESAIHCATELKSIGFDYYGIGSLAVIRNHKPIIERVKAITSVVEPKKIHVFGVSVVETIQALSEMGIHSIDSSRPAKSAAYNIVLYSSPPQRWGILEPEHIPMNGSIPRHRRLTKPLPCSCPICRQDASQILGVGKRHFIRARALHNYYHLKKIVSDANYKY